MSVCHQIPAQVPGTQVEFQRKIFSEFQIEMPLKRSVPDFFMFSHHGPPHAEGESWVSFHSWTLYGPDDPATAPNRLLHEAFRREFDAVMNQLRGQRHWFRRQGRMEEVISAFLLGPDWVSGKCCFIKMNDPRSCSEHVPATGRYSQLDRPDRAYLISWRFDQTKHVSFFHIEKQRDQLGPLFGSNCGSIGSKSLTPKHRLNCTIFVPHYKLRLNGNTSIACVCYILFVCVCVLFLK